MRMYSPPAALLAVLLPAALAAASGKPIELTTFDIGDSRHGRPLVVHRIGTADGDAQPAILVVAGADGRHALGPKVAEALAQRLAADANLLHGAAVYVLPDLNPDHSAWRDDPSTPRADWGGTIAPYDADRDGRIGEDGGDDLNGDGFITMMRVRDPDPRFALRTDWIIDPDEPRLMRRADAAKGEVGTHALLIESLDNDGDGRFAEDGIAGEAGGGIDLNLNFPALWPEFTDRAGQIPLSEPESLAFVEWMLERHNIMAVVVYGPHDNLVAMPVVGRHDSTGRVPIGIEEGDRAVHERVSERYREISRRTTSPAPDDAGSLGRWTYAHLGLPTFATRLWSGYAAPSAAADADAESAADPNGDEAAPAAEAPAPPAPPGPDAERPRGRGGAAAAGSAGARRGAPATGRSGGGASGDDATWLKASDARNGAGFVEWTAFDHPQLGEVEIGGFVPGFRWNPPDDELEAIIEQQVTFVSSLLEELPRIAFEPRGAERLAPGLWRVGARVRNDAAMPTSSAIFDKTRRHAPLIAVIEIPPASIVSGTRLVRLPSLRGGDFADASWLVRAEDGAEIELTLRSRVFGDRNLTIRLEETNR